MDAVQAKQASLSEDILQLDKKIEKAASSAEELEKRIFFLEGHLTSNISDLQNSVDSLSKRLDVREAEAGKSLGDLSKKDAETRAKLEALTKDIERRFSSLASENKELLEAVEATKKSSFMTGYEHVVESGETLGQIAKGYGVTVQAVIEANDMIDPDTLKVGQKLFIPK